MKTLKVTTGLKSELTSDSRFMHVFTFEQVTTSMFSNFELIFFALQNFLLPDVAPCKRYLDSINRSCASHPRWPVNNISFTNSIIWVNFNIAIFAIFDCRVVVLYIRKRERVRERERESLRERVRKKKWPRIVRERLRLRLRERERKRERDK